VIRLVENDERIAGYVGLHMSHISLYARLMCSVQVSYDDLVALPDAMAHGLKLRLWPSWQNTAHEVV
jgi:hypothetical protein